MTGSVASYCPAISSFQFHTTSLVYLDEFMPLALLAEDLLKKSTSCIEIGGRRLHVINFIADESHGERG